MSITTEATFESALESHLLSNGWIQGDPKHFDRETVIDHGQFLAFVESSQTELWESLRKQYRAA